MEKINSTIIYSPSCHSKPVFLSSTEHKIYCITCPVIFVHTTKVRGVQSCSIFLPPQLQINTPEPANQGLQDYQAGVFEQAGAKFCRKVVFHEQDWTPPMSMEFCVLDLFYFHCLSKNIWNILRNIYFVLIWGTKFRYQRDFCVIIVFWEFTFFLNNITNVHERLKRNMQVMQ